MRITDRRPKLARAAGAGSGGHPRRVRLIVTFVLASFSCIATAASSSANSVRPDKSYPPSGNQPIAITAGPEGSLWFTEHDAIARVTQAGEISEFPSEELSQSKQGIATGSDGNLWFTERTGIGRATPSGSISEFSVPAGFKPAAIVSGPDGNLWFTDSSGLSRIGRITPAGDVTIFSGPGEGHLPVELASGSDAVWFTEGYDLRTRTFGLASIGRISPTGKVSEYPSGGGFRRFRATTGIAAGPEGDVWFGMGGYVGRLDPQGPVIRRFSLPPGLSIQQAVAGPDGNMWFAAHSGSRPGFPSVVRVTPNGRNTAFKVDEAGAVASITTGADGNIWFTILPQAYPSPGVGGRYIGRIATAQLPGTPEVSGDQVVAWRRWLTPRIACSGTDSNGACVGQLQFYAEVEGPRGGVSRRRIGSGSYELVAGESQLLHLPLTRLARRILAKDARLKAFAVFEASDDSEDESTTGQRVVLKRRWRTSAVIRHRHHSHHDHRS